MTDADRQRARLRKSDADRQRAYRVRQDLGKIILRVEVDEVPVAAALVAAGLLSERDAEDPTNLAAALSVAIAGWCHT
jgi:hypothetical protein